MEPRILQVEMHGIKFTQWLDLNQTTATVTTEEEAEKAKSCFPYDYVEILPADDGSCFQVTVFHRKSNA